MSQEIFDFYSDGSFRLKTSLKSMNDIAKLMTFVETMITQSQKCSKSIKLCQCLKQRLGERYLAEIVLDYITFTARDGTRYIDLISDRIRDRYPLYRDDPQHQLEYEWLKRHKV